MFRLCSLLVGGLVGAGVAMLMSPRTGEETRRELKNRLNDRYGDQLEQGRIRATELIKTSREMLDERLAQGQDLVNTAIERARTTIEEVSSTSSGSHIGAGPDEAVEITDGSQTEKSSAGSGTHQQF